MRGISNSPVTPCGLALLVHAERHYTDYQILNDMDCLLSEGKSRGDRRLLKAYAKLRRDAPNFRPRAVPSKSNHDWIDPSDLAKLHRMTALDDDTPPSNQCAVCGRGFSARRESRTCSARCRKALSRQGDSHTYGSKMRRLASLPRNGQNGSSEIALTRGDAVASVTGVEVAA